MPTSRVTVRFLVDEDTYNKTCGATMKHPVCLDQILKSLKGIKDLRNDVKLWLGARSLILNEVRIPKSEKAFALKLNSYHCDQFYKQFDAMKGAVIVGDAALGVPFYRSLNNGLLTGTNLAENLSIYLKGHSDLNTALENYSEFMQKLVTTQTMIADFK